MSAIKGGTAQDLIGALVFTMTGFGLGLVEQMAVVPHHDSGAAEHLWRILELAPKGVPVAGIPERTALLREPGGGWRAAGEGEVTLFLDGQRVSLDDLAR